MNEKLNQEKSIGLELRTIHHLIMRYFEKSAVHSQVDRITGANGWIIRYLAKNKDKDVYQKDLEENFSITRSTVSKVLILMEQKGLIERHSVAHDARLKKLVLTEKAWKIDAMMKDEGKQMERNLLKGFSKEEIENVSGYLQRMKNNLKSLDEWRK